MTTSRTPKYCRQRRKNGVDQSYVKLNGTKHYLGAFDSPDSRKEYHRRIAEWLADGRTTPVAPDAVTVVELASRFWTERVKDYYRHPDGTPTS